MSARVARGDEVEGEPCLVPGPPLTREAHSGPGWAGSGPRCARTHTPHTRVWTLPARPASLCVSGTGPGPGGLSWAQVDPTLVL